jgi:hypothetical protein
MPQILTPEQIADILTRKKNQAFQGELSNLKLAQEYGVSEECIRRHTSGLQLNATPEPESQEEKIESALHLEMLSALKDAEITPKVVAEGLKKLLDSPDLPDVRDAIKEITKIMGVYAKEKGPAKQGDNVSVQLYTLRLPKRVDDNKT